jgi:hypothetical protein
MNQKFIGKSIMLYTPEVDLEAMHTKLIASSTKLHQMKSCDKRTYKKNGSVTQVKSWGLSCNRSSTCALLLAPGNQH